MEQSVSREGLVMDLSLAYSKLCSMERDLRKIYGGKAMEGLPKCIGDVTIQLIWDEGFMRIALHAYDAQEHVVTLDEQGFDILIEEMQKLRAKQHGVETLNFDSYETILPMNDGTEDE